MVKEFDRLGTATYMHHDVSHLLGRRLWRSLDMWRKNCRIILCVLFDQGLRYCLWPCYYLVNFIVFFFVVYIFSAMSMMMTMVHSFRLIVLGKCR